MIDFNIENLIQSINLNGRQNDVIQRITIAGIKAA